MNIYFKPDKIENLDITSELINLYNWSTLRCMLACENISAGHIICWKMIHHLWVMQLYISKKYEHILFCSQATV